MDKENTNQNITPVFWDENDGKWQAHPRVYGADFGYVAFSSGV